MEMYYAICDKYGVVRLDTVNDNDIITSTNRLIYATKERAENQCKILNDFYGYDTSYDYAFFVKMIYAK